MSSKKPPRVVYSAEYVEKLDAQLKEKTSELEQERTGHAHAETVLELVRGDLRLERHHARALSIEVSLLKRELDSMRSGHADTKARVLRLEEELRADQNGTAMGACETPTKSEQRG